MKSWLLAGAALALMAACSPQTQATTQAPATAATPAAAPAPSIEGLPAGAYTLDKAHAALVFRLSHLGFSHYTASFASFDAQMQLDPANPATATINATIDPRSLTLPTPPVGFKTELLGPHWLNAAQFPQVTFRSTAIEMTGANTARITGDLTLHGVTKPITLDAIFNGGYAGHPMDPHARLGFSAHGVFKRSDFGMAYGVPAPGTTMGVGDEVTVEIETEFSGPAWTPPPAAPATPATTTP